jgi:glycerol-3-phosphate dehydrogenase (NAD(P)+)
MKLGSNARAALMTRAIHEIKRLGAAVGAEPETFSGLSGIGDLIVTCTSGHSRNRYVGEELGKGRKLNDIIFSMGMMVAEGVTTASGAQALAKKVNVNTPIIDEICAILFDGKSPQSAIFDLMTRDSKPE